MTDQDRNLGHPNSPVFMNELDESMHIKNVWLPKFVFQKSNMLNILSFLSLKKVQVCLTVY